LTKAFDYRKTLENEGDLDSDPNSAFRVVNQVSNIHHYYHTNILSFRVVNQVSNIYFIDSFDHYHHQLYSI
jgi:hypothetical protein